MPPAAEPVHVIGASGRSGTALCRALIAAGSSVIPVARNLKQSTPAARIADITHADQLRDALHDAASIVACVHARFAPAIIAAAPSTARLILMGSTRKFTRWPDAHGNGVLAGEAAFLASGRNGVMLHPTMIYGAQGENNVQRLAALLRRTRVMPLPNGGRALVQPIHQDDVTQALIAALAHDWDGPHSLVIAGPEPVRYADFVRAVADAAGTPRTLILSFPAALLIWLAKLTGGKAARPDEIRRLTEDKAFDIGPARQVLGLSPISLTEGLARTFGATTS